MSEASVSPGAAALREWRERLGLERSQVAEMLGCTYYHVRLIELGERNPGGALQKVIAGVTGISSDLWSASEAA